eukprot:4629679-Ditylum_brightwellii.AAC.1
MTAALASGGYSLVELHASSRESNAGGSKVEDTFIVRPCGSKTQIDDDTLDEVSRSLLEATKHPILAHSLKSQIAELEADDNKLISRAKKLEELIEDEQINVINRKENTLLPKKEILEVVELHHAK